MMDVGTLMDNISQIDIELDKARTIMQELIEKYFNKYNIDNPNDRFAIAWEYERYGAFADILNDYIYKIYELVNSITNSDTKE